MLQLDSWEHLEVHGVVGRFSTPPSAEATPCKELWARHWKEHIQTNLAGHSGFVSLSEEQAGKQAAHEK